MPIRQSFSDTVGHTPLIRLNTFSDATGCEILGKAEFLNPGGSVKDRAARGILDDFENKGLLKPGGTLVEGTAGNTGIGFAHLCNARGYRCVIVMPDTTLEGAAQVAERFRLAFAATTIESVDGRQFSATISSGVAQLPEGVESVEAFVTLASQALKVAKASGGNRVRTCRYSRSDVAAEALPASTQNHDPFDLTRFVEAQSDLYQRFIGELRRGRKFTHCMWFMFPQLLGLGYSYESRRYGIKGLDEAVAYLAHPLLGARLRECAEALEALDPKLSVEDVFHYPDDLKLRSCLTLFAVAAGPGSIFERLIDRFFEGIPDHVTASRLGRWNAIEVEYQLGGHGRPKDLTTGPIHPGM